MTGTPEPDAATIADWIEGRLSPAEAAQVALRVDRGSARTQAMAEWMRSFLVTAQAMPLIEPPPIVRQSLRAHFERWRGVQGALRDEIARFEARVVYDSRIDLVSAGGRSGLRTELDGVVHLAFTSEAADLVLDVRSLGADRVRIDGQVLLARPTRSPIFAASVSGPGFTARTLDGDELGRFCLEDVPDTTSEVSVGNGEIEILAHVDVHSPRE